MKNRAPRWSTTVAVLALIVLCFDGVAAYRVAHREGSPSFRLGGQFAGATDLPPSSPGGAAAPGETAPSNVPATVALTTTTTQSPSRARVAVVPPTTRPTASSMTPATPAVVPKTFGPPAVGVYTYALRGSESATLAGTRTLGPKLSITAHGAAGLGPNQVVLDYSFSPDHEEREILSYDSGGVAFAFEGGSVSFGAISQTSQADYAPPMLQVPLPLVAGTTTHGASSARDAGGGTTRTEDWVVKVVGKEDLTVLGSTVPTWVVTVDRRTRPESADQVIRSRTYWYDPGRDIWVKVREHFDGHRSLLGLSFGFTADFEAVLSSFTAG